MTCMVMLLLVVIIITLLPISLVFHIVSTEIQGVLINLSAALCSAYKSRN